MPLRDWERERILRVLAEEGGSRKRAAERLGIPERTLRYRLRKYREAGYTVPGVEGE
jgi:two-component system response regulator FlrC